MLKAGLISGVGMFVLSFLTAVTISPICALCVPLVIGLLAGYLNGVFEHTPETVVSRGAMAGGIASAFGLAGQLIASVINAAVMQNPERQLNKVFGLPPVDAGTMWVVQIGLACVVGLINVGLTAGLGAGGGAIWKATAGKSQPPVPPAPIA